MFFMCIFNKHRPSSIYSVNKTRLLHIIFALLVPEGMKRICTHQKISHHSICFRLFLREKNPALFFQSALKYISQTRLLELSQNNKNNSSSNNKMHIFVTKFPAWNKWNLFWWCSFIIVFYCPSNVNDVCWKCSFYTLLMIYKNGLKNRYRLP